MQRTDQLAPAVSVETFLATIVARTMEKRCTEEETFKVKLSCNPNFVSDELLSEFDDALLAVDCFAAAVADQLIDKALGR